MDKINQEYPCQILEKADVKKDGKLSKLDTSSINSAKLNEETEINTSPTWPTDDLSSPTVDDIPQQLNLSQLQAKSSSESSEKILSLLLERGAEVNLCTFPIFPLHLAIQAGDLPLLINLLKHGANPNYYHEEKGLGSVVPLHLACSVADPAFVEMTKYLLQAGANPDLVVIKENQVISQETSIKSSSCGYIAEGLTSLHIAASQSTSFEISDQIVNLLLEYGAEVNVLYCGLSPLVLAVVAGNLLAVSSLLKFGADPNKAVHEDLGSILEYALSVQYESVWPTDKRINLITDLIEAGVNVQHQFKVGHDKKLSNGECMGSAMDYVQSMYLKDAKSSTHLLTETLGMLLKKKANEVLLYNKEIYQQQKLIGETESKDKNLAETDFHRKREPLPYCYQCYKSFGMALKPCPRCLSVLYCGKQCQNKSWEESHKEECFQLMVS